MSASAPLHTAAQLAAVLGRCKRTILDTLRAAGIPGAATVARGQAALGWTVESLPRPLREELERLAVSRHFRTAAHLLATPLARHVPVDRAGKAVPLNEIAEAHRDRAERLRRALGRAIAARDDADESGRVWMGLEDYRAEFGPVSERHWRRLFKRTLVRDAGEERFEDLALYFDEVVERAVAARKVAGRDRAVYEACMIARNPAKPTVRERELLWPRLCEEIAARVAAGVNEKRARADVARLLSEYGLALARNPAALKAQIKAKLSAWQAAEQDVRALCDARKGRSGRPANFALSDDERGRVVAQIVRVSGGRIEEGLRTAAFRGFLTQQNARGILRGERVPRALVDAVRSDVEALMPLHHGPRAHALSGPHFDRDWSGVNAGDWMQGDDTTAPVYWWEDGPHGPTLLRGQWLIFIDLRSLFVLTHVLIPEAGYSAVHVRGLMTRAMLEHGLPRRGFYFERNIWERSKLVTGPREVPWEVLESGFQRDFGLTFRHAQLPRGKPVERVFGHLQNRMESLPGYCGRDERHDIYERVQKKIRDARAGRIGVDTQFLSKVQMMAAFQEIVADYNRTPQHGKMLEGMSPLEGWIKLQGSDPRARFDESTAFLLSHVRTVPVTIKSNGLRFDLNGKSHAYFDEQTGARVGQRVRVYLNPDVPDLAFCEPENGGEIFPVRRHKALPAMDAEPEQFAREKSLQAAHLGYQRALYAATENVLPPSAYRHTLADRRTRTRAVQIESSQREAENTAQETNRLRQRVQRAGSAAHVPAGQLDATEDAVEALREMHGEASQARSVVN